MKIYLNEVEEFAYRIGTYGDRPVELDAETLLRMNRVQAEAQTLYRELCALRSPTRTRVDEDERRLASLGFTHGSVPIVRGIDSNCYWGQVVGTEHLLVLGWWRGQQSVRVHLCRRIPRTDGNTATLVTSYGEVPFDELKALVHRAVEEAEADVARGETSELLGEEERRAECAPVSIGLSFRSKDV